jgi:hypothetical protein
MTFSQARALIDPMSPEKALEKFWHDIINLPQDAVYSVKEWQEMYNKYTTGKGLQDTVSNAITGLIVDVLKEIWLFVYQNGYWIALFGGLAAILLYICGHKGALKWAWTLTLAYLIICSLGELL